MKKFKKVVYWFGLLIVLTGIVVIFFGSIKIKIEDKIRVTSTFAKATVEYDEIQEIKLVEDLDLGKRFFGVEAITILAGSFNNELFGNYTLLVYRNCDNFIVIKHNEKYLVFNSKTEVQTKEIYDSILEKMGK